MNQTLSPPAGSSEKSPEQLWTPGPWTNGHEGYNAGIIYDAGGEGVCGVYAIPINTKIADVGEGYATSMANANLIAAAPELYRILEYIANEAEREYACGHAVAAARAALSKAKGGE